MARRLGLTPEQCVGVRCYKAVHGTDAPPSSARTRTARQGRQGARHRSSRGPPGRRFPGQHHSAAPTTRATSRLRPRGQRHHRAQARGEEPPPAKQDAHRAQQQQPGDDVRHGRSGPAQPRMQDNHRRLRPQAHLGGHGRGRRAQDVRPVAWYGFEAGYLETLGITWSDADERGRGPTGASIRTGKTGHLPQHAHRPGLHAVARAGAETRLRIFHIPAPHRRRQGFRRDDDLFKGGGPVLRGRGEASRATCRRPCIRNTGHQAARRQGARRRRRSGTAWAASNCWRPPPRNSCAPTRPTKAWNPSAAK